MIDPVIKEITVPLSPDRAFKLFTEEMADWWPLDKHSMSAGDGETAKTVTVPKDVGAQVLEEKPDGTTTPWGRVTEYDPGKSFGMTWHVGRPEEDSTHVRVTFEAVADRTKVLLVHDNWQALSMDAVAMQNRYLLGWDYVFVKCFGEKTVRLSVPAHA